MNWERAMTDLYSPLCPPPLSPSQGGNRRSPIKKMDQASKIKYRTEILFLRGIEISPFGGGRKGEEKVMIVTNNRFIPTPKAPAY